MNTGLNAEADPGTRGAISCLAAMKRRPLGRHLQARPGKVCVEK